jgi:hypothetical protein
MQIRGIVPWVFAQKRRRAPVLAEKAQQNANRGRLPRAIGAQKAMHLTGGDAQVQSVERSDPTEVLGEVGNVDSSQNLFTILVGSIGLLVLRHIDGKSSRDS